MGTGKTGKLAALFMLLAVQRGYTEDEIVDLIFDVWKLPRVQQADAYMRGIEYLLGGK